MTERESAGERAAGEPPEDSRLDPTRPGLFAPSEDERAASARARGLSAPYIAGGRDPDPDVGRREERFYGRLLILMVAAIVAAGFILGIVANLAGYIGAD
jgi:hypothetical protein